MNPTGYWYDLLTPPVPPIVTGGIIYIYGTMQLLSDQM